MLKRSVLLLLNDKTKRNFFIYGVGQVFNLISPLVVAPLVISKCGADGYGKVGIGFALALFLILIVDYAFDVKGIKSVSENRYQNQVLEKLLSTTIFTKIILFTIVAVLLAILISCTSFFYQEKKLFILTMSIVFAQVFNPLWFFQGIENFKSISIVNIASKVTYVSLILIFIKNPSDYIYVNLYWGLSALFFNILGLTYIKKKYKFKVIVPSLNSVYFILKNDFSFCISQLFLSARQLSPLLLVSYFLGFSVAGQYRVIEQIINLFRTFSQVFLKFFYAKACYKFLRDLNTGWKFWKKYTAFNVLVIFSSVIVLVLFSKEVLRFFHLPESTVQELDFLFKLALLISFLMSFTLPLEQLMFILDKSKIYIKITIFVTIVNVIMLLIFIKEFQIFAIVVTLIVSELIFIAFYSYNTVLSTKQLLENENHLL